MKTNERDDKYLSLVEEIKTANEKDPFKIGSLICSIINNPMFVEKVKKDFKFLWDNFPINNKSIFIKAMSANSNYHALLIENIEYFISTTNFYLPQVIEEFLKLHSEICDIYLKNSFLIFIKQKKDNLTLIDIYKKYFPEFNVVDFYREELLNNLSFYEKTEVFLPTLLDEESKKYWEKEYPFFHKLYKCYKTSSSKKGVVPSSVFGILMDKKYEKMVSDLFKEYMIKENVTDFSFLGSGNYNFSYLVGRYVIRIGNGRGNFPIYQHYRISNSLYRKKIEVEKGSYLYLEVNRYTRVDQVNEKDIIDALKDLKSALIEITDYHYYNNFGLLFDDDDNETILSSLEDGIIGKIDVPISETFKKKRVVLIDNDYIYLTSDQKKYAGENPYLFLQESDESKKEKIIKKN